MMGGKVIHAPIDDPKKILDVGCGTGVVTELLASKFPKAQVFGLDLSKVPELRDRPSNVKFLQGNILDQAPDVWVPSGSLDKSGGLDLIFSRLLVCGMNDWPSYPKNAFSLLSSGGYMEIHDVDWVWFDSSGTEISADWAWWQRVRAAGESRGLNFLCASKAATWMRDAGFVDIQVSKYRWPFGGRWEKTEDMRGMGDYSAEAMPEMVHHMIPKSMEGQNLSSEEIEEMRKAMKKDLAPEEGKHWDFYVTVGRKP